jgi:hypothetical protein
LQRRDLVRKEAGVWRLTILLFGRWLRLHSQLHFALNVILSTSGNPHKT